MSDLSMAWLFGALVGFFTGVTAAYAYNEPGEHVPATRTDDWDDDDEGWGNENGHTPNGAGGHGGVHPDDAQGAQIHDGDVGKDS